MGGIIRERQHFLAFFGQWKLAYCQTGTKLYYEVIGSGEPILFHHGTGNSISDWYDWGYVDGLKDKHQLILFDVRGQGRSSKPHDAAQYSPEQLTGDSIAVLDAVGVSKAYCYGLSMGGRIAFALMQHYPERFDAFIIGGMHPYGSTGLRDNIADWLEKGMPYFVDEFEKVFGRFPAKTRARYLQNDAEALLIASTYPWPDLSEALRHINVPCLLYAGENDGVAPKIHQCADSLKYVDVKILPGMDHCQPFWNGDVSVKIIDGFLQTMARSRS